MCKVDFDKPLGHKRGHEINSQSVFFGDQITIAQMSGNFAGFPDASALSLGWCYF